MSNCQPAPEAPGMTRNLNLSPLDRPQGQKKQEQNPATDVLYG
ncbi:hypothetical protein M2337_002696 [Sphingobium sp. B2D3A]|nr:hypothetical protein [Sphingobium sp. B2D3A]MCW2384921.1 hypothetical protein [Sphingobium sp. B2D3D]